MQECKCASVQAFSVLGEPAAPVQPGGGSLHDPALGQDGKALGRIRPLDDLRLDVAQGPGKPGLELRACIAAIGIQLGVLAAFDDWGGGIPL